MFAGGDLVTGPASVIEAIQGERIAASSIDRYLGVKGEIEQKLIPDKGENPYLGREEGFAKRKRAEITKINVEDRFPGFKQVEFCLSKLDFKCKAERCLKCQPRLRISKAPLHPNKNDRC